MRSLCVSIMSVALLAGSAVGVAGQSEEQPPAAGTFEATGSLAQARADHSATLLPDGRVLITGGEGFDPDDLASAEVWDPTTDAFGPTDAEPGVEPSTEREQPDVGRTGHTATLLPDGRFLVVGGSRLDDPTATADAELWDPVAESYEPAGSLAQTRSGHSATLLPDGSVLVVGGDSADGSTASAEVWGPAKVSFRPAGSLTEARSGHTATFLRDGRVLVVGGQTDDGAIASAEIWTSAKAPAKCFGKRPTLFALPGVEMVGTSKADVIAGSVGADLIRGGGGNDRICAGGGADVVEGGGGKDRISGGGGDDRLDGGASNDTISGGKGADDILGGGGSDILSGSGGDDTIDGGKGKDRCTGGPGHDRLPGCNERFRTRGTLFVTRNTTLRGPHKGAIAITVNGVRLDCGGHTITGLGKQDRRLQGGIGIHFQQRRRVTVTDCHVTNFNVGMQNDGTRRTVIRHSSANGNWHGFGIDADTRMTDNVAIGNDNDGFGMGGGSNRLTGNVADDNGVTGFLVWSDRNVLKRNRARGNEENFATAEQHNTFIDNVSEGAPYGFRAGPGSHSNTFRGNTTMNDVVGFHDETFGASGIAGSRNTYTDNTCTGNRTPSIPEGLC